MNVMKSSRITVDRRIHRLVNQSQNHRKQVDADDGCDGDCLGCAASGEVGMKRSDLFRGVINV
jgi:hypothetical protein